MAQFRTTADLVDAVLNRSGETTSGTSPYEADALTYLNKIHSSIISGGLVFDTNVNEDWKWARSRYPYVLKLVPPYSTGTVTATNGADAITLSAAPSYSLEDWYLRFDGETTVYRIAHHNASNTAAQLEGHYIGTSGAGKSFEIFKLDYDVIPTHLYITGTNSNLANNKLDFGYSGSTEVTATITHGSYTPSELATEINTQLTASGGGTSTYTVTYSAVTRKFTLASSRTGGNVFILYGAGTNAASSVLPTLGFDYATQANAASQVSTYPLGGVARIVAPIRAYRNGMRGRDITGIDEAKMREDFPLAYATKRVPTNFAVVRENPDGLQTIRFDSYPAEEMKVEIEVCEIPLDLKDSTASVPKIPRKYSDILEYGAAYYILLDKEDDKAQAYMQLAQAQLKLMQEQYRAQLARTDAEFGGITPRADRGGYGAARARYGYDSGNL